MTTTPLCPDIDDMAVDRLWVQFHALTGLIRKLDSKLLDEIPRLDDRLEVLRIEAEPARTGRRPGRRDCSRPSSRPDIDPLRR
jgi:hypothetical protein